MPNGDTFHASHKNFTRILEAAHWGRFISLRKTGVFCAATGWHGVCLSTGNKAIATASKQINKDLVKRGGLKSLSEGQLSAPLFFYWEEK